MSNEEFYDTEIAPKLLELCNLCGDRGMSMVSAVEYSPNKIGETTRLVGGHGIEILMAYWGIKARGNFDSLAIAAARHANGKSHSSMVLSQIGVPCSPNESREGQ